MKLPWTPKKIRKSILEDLNGFYRIQGHAPNDDMAAMDLRCMEVARRLSELRDEESRAARDQIDLVGNALLQLEEDKVIHCKNFKFYVWQPPTRISVRAPSWPRIEQELRPCWKQPWVTDWLHVLLTALAVIASIIAVILAARAN